MPTPSSSDATLIRSGPPVVRYYLAILPRGVLFRCSLNLPGATWSEMTLPYDNVTVGAWGSVTAGQTLLVYSSGGTYKGKVRLRSITASQIVVAANDDIEWADNDRLDVVNVFEPWSRPSRTDDQPSGLVFYKDTDIAWPGNNAAFPPKANGGVGWAGFLGSGSFADVAFDGQESFANAPGATIASYSWDIGDGAFVVGNAASPAVTARFSSATFRWVTLTVTDSNGVTGVQCIPVWTFGGAYQPLDDNSYEITRRVYDVRNAELQVVVSGDTVTESDIVEGTCVALFTETTIGGATVTTDIGARFAGRRSVPFIGWILKDSVRWNYEDGTVSFTIGNLAKYADNLRGFPTFIGDENVATRWHEGQSLTVRNVIFWLLYWHTNLMELAFFECDATELIAGRKFPKAAPLKQVENAFLMQRGVFARLGCSRWSSLHIRYDPQEMSETDRAGRATVLDLTSADWHTELEVGKSHTFKASTVLGGGIAYDGVDGTPYRGRAPGRVGRESSKHIRADNLIIEGQTQLNSLLGALIAAESSPWSDVSITTYYDIFEPALQEYITLTVAAADNPRGRAFSTNDLWIVRRLEISDTPLDAPEVRLTVELLVDPLVGVTVPIPDPPTLPAPPPPPGLPPPLEDEETSDGQRWAFGTVGGGVIVSADFKSGAPPVFAQYNVGLADTARIRWFTGNPDEDDNQLACIDDDGDGVYVLEDWAAGMDLDEDDPDRNVWELVLTKGDVTGLLGLGGGSCATSGDWLGSAVCSGGGSDDNSPVTTSCGSVTVARQYDILVSLTTKWLRNANPACNGFHGGTSTFQQQNDLGVWVSQVQATSGGSNDGTFTATVTTNLSTNPVRLYLTKSGIGAGRSETKVTWVPSDVTVDFLQCKGGKDGILYVAARVTESGADPYIVVLMSADWGTTWGIAPKIDGYYGLDGACDYDETQDYGLNYKADTMATFGQIEVTEAGYLLLAARSAPSDPGSEGRSCVTARLGGAWSDIDWPRCAAGTFYNLGGMLSALNGPGGVCEKDGEIFMGCWAPHELSGAASDYYLAKYILPYSVELVGAVDNDYACQPDMLFESPALAGQFFALEFNTTLENTRVYRDSIVVAVATLPIVCQVGRCHPTIVDSSVMVVVGRAYGNAAYRAGPGDTLMLYRSLDNGATFDEIGSSLYGDFGVTGITGMFSTTEDL